MKMIDFLKRKKEKKRKIKRVGVIAFPSEGRGTAKRWMSCLASPAQGEVDFNLRANWKTVGSAKLSQQYKPQIHPHSVTTLPSYSPTQSLVWHLPFTREACGNRAYTHTLYHSTRARRFQPPIIFPIRVTFFLIPDWHATYICNIIST